MSELLLAPAKLFPQRPYALAILHADFCDVDGPTHGAPVGVHRPSCSSSNPLIFYGHPTESNFVEQPRMQPNCNHNCTQLS
jgi:hypothetical protein